MIHASIVPLGFPLLRTCRSIASRRSILSLRPSLASRDSSLPSGFF